jgi:sodium-dependent dicarboxylate transporter 2/3/5
VGPLDARRTFGLVAGPLAGVYFGWGGAHDPAVALAGILVLTAIWWITEAVPVAVTALVSSSLVVLFGVATPKVAFAAYGSPLLFLFVGSFFIAEAMRVHGLGARVAGLLARRASGRLSMLIALSSVAFVLSMWLSNSAATAVLLPIAVSAADRSKDRGYGAALVLAVAYGASVGGMGTPVGTPPNIIGIAQMQRAGVEIDFLEWMSIGVPLGVVMMAALWAVLTLRYGVRPGQPLAEPSAPEAASVVAGPWSQAEIGTTVAFLVAVVGWFAPGLAVVFAPDAAITGWLDDHLTEEVVALTAAALLFVWPAGGRPVLTWDEAQHIDWSTILLFGGGILLGDLAGTTGLTQQWGSALVEATGAQSTLALTALVAGVSIVLSEATSNTATATLMVPLAMSMASALGLDPIAPAMGATLGASFGFMMPVSTAPNAMAYGTGKVTIGQMATTGVVFDAIGLVAIVGAVWLWA